MGVPTVTGAVFTPTNQLGEAGSYTLTLTFSEVMNTGTNPLVFFPTLGENPAAALTVSSQMWLPGATSFLIVYTVNDQNLDIPNIDIRVGNAFSASTGDPVDPAVRPDVFSIDQRVSTPGAPDLVAASDLGAAPTDDLTADNTPTFQVSIAPEALGEIKAGDTVRLIDTSNGNAIVGSQVVSAGDVTQGFVLVTASTLADGTHAIAARVTDSSGNTRTGVAGAPTMIDTANPTVTVNIVDTSLNDADSVSNVTFTFSEAVDPNSVMTTPTNGTLSALVWNMTNTEATATFTATDGVAGTGSVTVASFTDAAGNDGIGGSDTVTIDTLNPTVTVNIVDTSLNDADSVSNVTFTFSEAPVNFTAADITATNGAVTGLTATGDPLVYTATFTANDGFAGQGSVSVGTAYQDAAGNDGIGGSDTVTIDTANPTVTVNIVDTSLNDTDSVSNVTFTFSEAVDPNSVMTTPTNGTLSALVWNMTNTEATATFTATDGVAGTGSVTVASFTDAAGNDGIGGSDTVTIDTLNPTVTVNIVDTSLNDADSVSNVTFTFSEAPVNFTAADITATNGAVTGLTATGDPLVYTATFMANDGFAGQGSVSVGTAYQDAAGNDGIGGSDTVTIDTANPTVTVNIVDTSLNDADSVSNVTFTFSEAPVNFTAADITATNGAVTGLTATGDPLVYTATFTANDGFAGQGSVSVGTAYQDAAGNDGIGGSDTVTIDTANPTVTVNIVDTSLNDTDSVSNVTFTFSEAVDPNSVMTTPTNGTLSALVWNMTNTEATATFTATDGVAGTGSVTVASFTDAAGNDGIGGSDTVTIDTLNPTVTVNIVDTSLNDADSVSNVTFTFSEAPVNFTAADITATNGAVTGLTATGDPLVYTATFMANDGFAGQGSVSVGTAYQDAAGNDGIGGSDTVTIDTANPTVTVNIVDTSLNDADSVSNVTFTFSEAPVNFTAADITATNGAVTGLTATGDPLVYTATFTANDGFAGQGSVSVGTAYQDAAGNDGIGGSDTVTIDTANPTVTVNIVDTSLNDTDSVSNVTFTFSEAVDPNSVMTTPTNGTLSALVWNMTNTEATATFTATDGVAGTGSVTVASFTDAAGNDGIGGSDTVTIDTLNPTVTVNIVDTSLNDADSVSNVTFTFSEAPVNFTAADITATNGAVTGLTATGDPLVYTATFMANDGFAGQGSVSVGTAYQDAAGNDGIGGSDTVTIDTLNPTVTVNIVDTSLNDADSVSNVTFTFSEAPVNFTAADITATNGAVTGLTATGDPLVYTATFTANDGFAGQGSVSVGTAYQDAAGNDGIGGSDTVTIDTANPTVTVNIVDTSLNDTDSVSNVTFTFSEAVDPNSVMTTPTNGTLSALVWNMTNTEATATFTATDGVAGTGSVTVASFTDAAGNDGIGGSDTVTIDTLNPTVTVNIVDTSLNDADSVSNVTFTFSEAPVNFTAADITATNGAVTGLTATGDPLVYTATFMANDGFAGQGSVSVGTAYQDAAGNDGIGGSDTVTIDTLNPTVTVNIVDTSLNDADSVSNVTFTFSEAPVNFTAADITATNGAVTGLTATGDPLVYTATFTANDGFAGQGSVSVGTAYQDAAGNDGIGGSDTVTIDTANPLAPMIDLDTASDTAVGGNASTADNLTYDSTPTFTVTAEANSLVNVYLDGGGTPIASQQLTGGNTTFVFTVPTALAAASYAFTATATDASGNVSSAGMTATNPLLVTINFTGGSLADTIIGSSDDDVIDGRGGNDTLDGGAGDDQISGGSGNDTITGGDGADFIDGGSGTGDVAVFDALFNYSVGRSGSDYIITDNRTGDADTVRNVETLRFAGVDYSTVNAAPVGVDDVNGADVVIEVGTSVAGDPLAQGNVLANDTDPNLGETLTVSGIRTGAESAGGAFLNVAGNRTVVGTYGSLEIAADGSYFYTLNDSDPDTQALPASTAGVDIFTYRLRDAQGATDIAEIRITINGSNDAAVIAGMTTGSVTEAGGVSNGTAGTPTATGLLTATDVDNAPNTFQTVTAGTASTGGYGTYAVTAGGVWTYTLDNANTTVQALNNGGMLTDTFAVAAADGTTQAVTITITGTNDAAVIAGDTTRSLTETNAVLTTSGLLTITDPDSATTFVAQAGTVGSYGTFVLGTNGGYTYTTSSAHDEFVGGQTYTDMFTAAAADGTTQAVTITITGTNDAAVIAGDTTGSLTETNAVLTTSGLLTITDPDSATTFVAQAGTVGSYGTFVLGTNGGYTYTTSSAHDEFVGGQTYTDMFTAAAADGTTQAVTITITGTNDAAVIAGDTTGSLTETNAVLTTSGLLTITDPDSATTFVAQAGTVGSYGTFVLGTNGGYTYTTSSAHDEFVDGQTYTDMFTAAAADGTTQAVTITITGTNDAPRATADFGVVREASNLMGSASVLANDSDPESNSLTITSVTGNQTVAVASAGMTTVAGAFGTLQIRSDGTYSYLSNSDGDDFGTDVFTYEVSDGISSSAATLSIEVLEQGIRALDPSSLTPAGFTHVGTTNGATAYNVSANHAAALELGMKIQYRFGADLAATTQELDGTGRYLVPFGSQVVDPAHSVPFAAANRAAWSLHYSINTGVTGSPDAPSGSKTLADYNVMLTISDGTTTQIYDMVQAGAGNTPFQLRGGNLGTGFSDEDGLSPYIAQNSINFGFDFLSAAFPNVSGKEFTVTLSAIDIATGNTAALVTDILTVNTPPTAVSDLNIIVEDAASVSGNVLANDTDVNNPQAHSVTAVNGLTANVGQSVTGSHGTFVANADGSYVYTLNNADNAVQALNVGGQLQDVFSYTNTDSTNGSQTAQVTITINGTNDAAVVAGTTTGSVTEAGGVSNGTAGTPTATGTLTATDVDNAPNTFQTVTAGTASTGGYGTYAVTAGGVWTYTLDNANTTVQALNNGGMLTDTFAVAAADGTTQAVTITITGTNDAAVIAGDTTGSLTETNAVLTTSGLLTITDPDSATTFVAQAGTVGSYGTFVLGTNGGYTYTTSSAHDEFVGGQTYTDMFTAAAADGTTQAVTITITGTNDAAVIAGDTTGSLTETNAVLTTSGLLTITDPDSATTFVAQAGTVGSYGTFVLGTNGGYTYTTSSAHDEFVGGQTYTDMFTAAAADGTTQAVTITITGTNDAAVIAGDTTGSLTETNAVLTTSGLLTITDPDSATTFVAQAGTVGSYGTFVLGTNGGYTYTTSSAHDEFVGGQTYTDMFTAAAADGTTQAVTITITGTNDAAVIAGDTTGSLTETNAVLTTSGLLTITDPDSATTFVAQAGTVGSYGTFVLGTNGGYTYTTSSAHDEFVGGQTYTDMFTAAAADGTTQAVTITITGTNDAAVIAGDTTGSLTETNAVLTTSGLLTITDPDSATTFVAQAGTVGSYGTFVLGTNGGYTYTTSSAHDEFVGGQTYTDMFTAAAADGTTQAVTITITGTNDAAVIAGTTTGSVTEAGGVSNRTPGTPTVMGMLTAIDPDNTSNLFQAVGSGTASTDQYGTFGVTSGGVWTYTLNNNNAGVQALNLGSTLTDHFTVMSQDGTAQIVTITISGTNDLAAKNNFNGDLKSDLVRYNDALGSASVTLLDGLSPISTTTIGPANGAVWDIKATGDLNGDGQTDLIWQNSSTGQVVAYLMNGTNIQAAAIVGEPGTSFRVVGAGDLNGDNKADIVLQDGNGQAVGWLMNGISISTAAAIGVANGATWSVAAVGDLNGDNHDDLVWQDTSGRTAGFLMDGTTIQSAAALAGPNGANFSVRGIGDLNGDAKGDIIWQYSNGQAGAWLMNGLSIQDAKGIGSANGSQWQVRNVSDLNGDGNSDLLWEDMTNGQAVGFLMSSTNIVSASTIGSAVGADWKIV